jgi:tripartite-type tricarboxylate transporter receptor subunit TctC
MFKILARVDIIHVPYKGSGQAILDLVGGNVSMNFDVMPPVIEHIRQGRLRALAVTTLKRSSQLPDVPTMNEVGLKGFEMSNWYAVFGPAGTPRDIVAKLNADFNKALQDPPVRKRLTDAGTEIGGASAEWLDSYIRTEVVKYAKLVKDARVQID